ncbi:MAG: CaiB/BaiF CoA transferase family protein [Dehalococcoidia bacterium]
MTFALDGLKVLDLSRLAPGPYCSMLLADFGADVLLIEAAPGVSSKLAEAPREGEAAQRGAAYNALRRGKRSISLNLKDPAGLEVFRKLAREADVVLEGFRPGVVKRLGVDYESVREINPRAVYCSLSGFGQSGPYSNLVGHDINYISIGGALGIIGQTDGRPALPGNIVADFAGGGLMAAFAICVALLARERTGEGQCVDVAMSDGVFYLMASIFSGYFATGNVVRPGQSTLTGSAPWYNTYRCSDGRWFSLGSIEPHFYDALLSVVGLEEFRGRQHDRSCHEEMEAKLAEAISRRPAQEWMDIMSEHDICAAPVLTVAEAAEDPHNLARGLVLEVDSPIGKVKQPGIGPKLSATPGAVRSTAPVAGQHTDDVLASLGYTAAEIAGLRTAGTVA